MAQMYLIGDELTAKGFGLAGVKRAYSATSDNVKEILNEIKNEAELIVITHELYEHAEDSIKKMQSAGKIIIKIPDRSGGGEDIISKLIKDTVGFEIKSKKTVKEDDNKVINSG